MAAVHRKVQSSEIVSSKANTWSQGKASGAESSNSDDCQHDAEHRASRGHKVQGPKSRRRQQGPERVSHVYCAQDVKIKKNTMTFIPAYLD